MDQRIAEARSAGETSFLSSDFGTYFLEHYRIELLKYFEHTTDFLGKLGPACVQYFQVGVERALARAREQGFTGSVDEAALLTDFPEPIGWNDDKSQPADAPWWTLVLEVARKKADLASDEEDEEGDQE
ncbi:non-specific serine/threonine protein kinase [Striga asiatica]|uniref:Non-specific serine/threonine protein kinase n=1 Tax=Striga asiatica TaxID=4170 RepID=A0A5A7PMR3_STRAF|nr:non-specific serine/threonine protein kinase [Striga asiatica]